MSPTELAWVGDVPANGFDEYWGWERISEIEDFSVPCDASPGYYPTYQTLTRALKAGHRVAYRNTIYSGTHTVEALMAWTKAQVAGVIEVQKAAKAAEIEADRLKRQAWKEEGERQRAELDAKIAELRGELQLTEECGGSGHAETFRFLPKEKMVKKAPPAGYHDAGWIPEVYLTLAGKALVDERVGKIYTHPSTLEVVRHALESIQRVREAKQKASEEKRVRETEEQARKKAEAEELKLRSRAAAELSRILPVTMAKIKTRPTAKSVSKRLPDVKRWLGYVETEVGHLDEKDAAEHTEVVEQIRVWIAGAEELESRLLPCHICGELYTASGLKRHAKACQEAQAEEQAAQVAREAERKAEEAAKRALEEQAKASEQVGRRDALLRKIMSTRSAKNGASERQVSFITSLWEKVFGAEMPPEAAEKVSHGSKAQASALIDALQGEGVAAGKVERATQKQVAFATSLLQERGETVPNLRGMSKGQVSSLINRLLRR